MPPRPATRREESHERDSSSDPKCPRSVLVRVTGMRSGDTVAAAMAERDDDKTFLTVWSWSHIVPTEIRETYGN